MAGTGRPAAVLRLLVRLPAFVFASLLGREWLVEVRAAPSPP